MAIKSYKGLSPKIDPSAVVMENTVVAGDVTIGPDSSVWFGATIRGDMGKVIIGARTNIQENAVIHESTGRSPVIIEEDVTVGHGAIIHGAIVRSGSLIGMGATILDDSEIGEECLVAANALVPERVKIPAGSLVIGMPAKVVRPLNEFERMAVRNNAAEYVEFAREYRTEETTDNH